MEDCFLSVRDAPVKSSVRVGSAKILLLTLQPQTSMFPSGCLRDGFVFERGEDAFKKIHLPSSLAEEGFAGAFGMRHQAGHVALLIADARDVLQSAVGIRGVRQVSAGVAVLPQDLVVGLEFRERFFVGKIAAFAVGDRYAENFSRRNLAGKWRIRRCGLKENISQ